MIVDDDDEEEEVLQPYDERQQNEAPTGGKKNKLPFSFLVHHYMKTNNGPKIAAQDP